jgi:16S rRNA (cytosine967-C5)-methyltransferase
MNPAARVQTAIELLDAIIIAARDGGAAADTVATRFFKERRYAGSGDRRAIRELVWRAIRRFGKIPASGRSAMVALADKDAELAALFTGEGRAPAAIIAEEPRATGSDMPKWLVPHLDPLIDAEEARALLERAPLDLRLNPLRVAQMEDEGLPLPTGGESLPAPLLGLRFPPDTNLLDHPAMQLGAVEVQDAGSQWIAQACQARPGMTVVDLCAGAGGKTLALAAAMAGEDGDVDGLLVACDTDRRRLQQLPPRAERAGVERIDARLLDPKREWDALEDLDVSADVVLVDAPCSGSGTWRRNPDGRWRLTPQRLAALVAEQARLLDLAAKLVAPGGALVYAVCAITREEGEAQVASFLQRHVEWTAESAWACVGDSGLPGRPSGSGRLLTPAHDATDGFFIARIRAH